MIKLEGEMQNTVYRDQNGNVRFMRSNSRPAEIIKFDGEEFKTRLIMVHAFKRGNLDMPYYDYETKKVV